MSVATSTHTSKERSAPYTDIPANVCRASAVACAHSWFRSKGETLRGDTATSHAKRLPLYYAPPTMRCKPHNRVAIINVTDCLPVSRRWEPSASTKKCTGIRMTKARTITKAVRTLMGVWQCFRIHGSYLRVLGLIGMENTSSAVRIQKNSIDGNGLGNQSTARPDSLGQVGAAQGGKNPASRRPSTSSMRSNDFPQSHCQESSRFSRRARAALSRHSRRPTGTGAGRHPANWCKCTELVTSCHGFSWEPSRVTNT
jgi:hypothetical protein